MKLSEFIIMSEAEKNRAVLHEGILVAKRKDPEEIRFLFQLDSFYVEMQCNYLSHRVCGYQAFTNINHLKDYLDEVQINGLL